MNTYLKDLIEIPSVSTNIAANKQAVDYMQTFLTERGLFCERFTFSEHDALVATTKKGNKRPKVLLAVHIDVVPAPPEMFALTERDGKYYGRGVFDMKFAAASYMEAIDLLGDDVHTLDIGIMVTTEEEMGGLEGVAQLVDLGYLPEVVILPDGAHDWQIETLAKGFLYSKVEVTGKAAHGSKPWDGDSATYKLLDFLQELRAFFSEQTLHSNTLNIGMLEGGAAKNQIPPYASASLDIRFISPDEKRKIEVRINELCAKYGAVYTEEPLRGAPCINSLSDPLIAPFIDSIRSVVGIDSSGTISTGASDARFFAEKGIPAIICRPAGGGQHADGEWIDKAGYEQYAHVLVNYLQKVARSQ